MTALFENLIEIETGANPEASVIWLHGLGADGHDFEGIVPALAPPVPTRFVFPHAPYRSVTLNAGHVMRAWYDIYAISEAAKQDEAGIRESEALLAQLIERECARGVACARIVLAGFSQGGAVVLHTGLRFPQRLGGVIALSTYLPLHDLVHGEMQAANSGIPVFMAHGLHDPIVPLSLGERSRVLLQRLGANVRWHTYPIPHTVTSDVIADLAAWLRERLSA